TSRTSSGRPQPHTSSGPGPGGIPDGLDVVGQDDLYSPSGRQGESSAQPSCHDPRDTSHSTGEVIMPSDLTKIAAKIYLLRPEEGGRKTHIFTGYRPAVYVGDSQTDGLIVFSREEKPVLGGEYTVTIALAHPEYLGDALQQDATFDCREDRK